MGGWVMVSFYQFSGKKVIQKIKMEQDFEAHASLLLPDEECETDKKKVILRLVITQGCGCDN